MGISCGKCGFGLKTIPSFPAYSPTMVHSSKIFSPEDIEESQTTIKSIKSVIKSINRDIHHMFSHLAKLRNDRSRLQLALASHQSVVAPIRRLHPEILVEIFSHCGLVTSLAYLVAHNTNDSQNRNSIGRVCKQWRDVLTNTPILWSSMRIHDQDNTGWGKSIYSMAVIAKRLRQMLSRSGVRPLTLYIDLSCLGMVDVTAHDSENAERVNQLLKLHAPRWQHIKFSTIPPAFTLPQVLPLIEHIDIPAYVNMESMTILSAPKLESARIVGIYEQPCNIALPWMNLLRLCLAPVFIGWHQILRKCTSLQELEISVTHEFQPWGGPTVTSVVDIADPPIISPTIRILSFNLGSSEIFQSAIWDSLTLPNLNQVIFNHYDAGDRPHFASSSFSQMLIRSRCTVDSVHIGGTFEIPTIPEILPLLGTVTSLSLEYDPRCAWGNNDPIQHVKSFFSTLTDDQTLLPLLTKLTISIDHAISALVLDLIDSRWNPSAYALRKAASLFQSLAHIQPHADHDSLRHLLKLLASAHKQDLLPTPRLQAVVFRAAWGYEWYQDLVQDMECLEMEGLAVSWEGK